MANLYAKVTGTRTFTITVDLPHTILLNDTEPYFFRDCQTKPVNELGVWNAELDQIKNQLPIKEKCFQEVLKKINDGQIRSYEMSWLFSPTKVTWEEN